MRDTAWLSEKAGSKEGSTTQVKPDVEYISNDEDDESQIKHKRVDRLKPLERAILEKIREINVQRVIEAHPKDVEIIRNKVVAELCDEDRNFARYYMSLIVKDMRELHKRRGLPDKSELPTGDDGNSLIDSEDELEQQKRKEITELEGNLFQLFKKLCQFIENDKK